LQVATAILFFGQSNRLLVIRIWSIICSHCPDFRSALSESRRATWSFELVVGSVTSVETSFQPRIIFITGTDTGVGKTVLTALLLSHLRQTGVSAFALKLFCSGGRADADLLHSIQNGDLTLDEINPYYFSEPLAPLVAARLHNRKITLRQTLGHIQQITGDLNNPARHRTKNPILLIEGAGGLFAPLGENFNLLDLILTASRIRNPTSSIQIITVAPNRLGTINHTLLTVRALQASKSHEIKVVLMDIDDHSSSRNTQHAIRSPSRITHHASRLASRTNPSILSELLFPIPLFCLPYFGKNADKTDRIPLFAKKLKKTLADILS
jgi:dethiobiotin synthetase